MTRAVALAALAALSAHPAAAARLINTDGLSIRLFGLETTGAGALRCHCAVRPVSASASAWSERTAVHEREGAWTLDGDRSAQIQLGHPDALFAAAFGADGADATGDADAAERSYAALRTAAPHWPEDLLRRLSARGVAGAGVVALDARWFASRLLSSPFDSPMLLPRATTRLGLHAIGQAQQIAQASSVSLRAGRCDVADHAFVEVLGRASRAAGRRGRGAALGGRLVGEWSSGELAQVGDTIGEGLRHVAGSGPLRVTFEDHEPLGLGIAPLEPSNSPSDSPGGDSLGRGAEVCEVDAGSAAERAGVAVGMVFARCRLRDDPDDADATLSLRGRSDMAYEEVLRHIDERREAGGPLEIVFDTCAPVKRRCPRDDCVITSVIRISRWSLCAPSFLTTSALYVRSNSDQVRSLYAVEMPAAASLSAFAEAEGLDGVQSVDPLGEILISDDDIASSDGGGISADRVLWSEAEPKLFVGDAGSMTAVHVDICPQAQRSVMPSHDEVSAAEPVIDVARCAAQVEVAHCLCGTKLFGVASHGATDRILGDYCADADADADAGSALGEEDEDWDDGDEEEGGGFGMLSTRVPSDRPLDATQAALVLLCCCDRAYTWHG